MTCLRIGDCPERVEDLLGPGKYREFVRFAKKYRLYGN